MIRRRPRAKRTYRLFPYKMLIRSRIFRESLRERETDFLRGKTMALRIFKSIFGSPAAITPDPLLGAVLVVRRALGVEKKPLDMQRLLYIAQVEHIGQFAAPIFPDIFNATSLGPIIPRLMPLLKRKKIGRAHV